MKSISNHVEDWIERLSKVHSWGHSICPYARKAKYQLFTNEDKMSMQLKASFYDHSFDLYLCLPTDQYMSVERAKQIEKEINMVSNDTITLLDHPKDPGFINGVCTGNKKYIIFFIQSKKGLQDARNNLLKSSYYNSWDHDYYEKITNTGL